MPTDRRPDIVAASGAPAGFYPGDAGGGRENLTVPEQRLTDAGISMVQVERGGNITYHGPGQLVGYPIIDLKTARMDVHTYVSRLEDIMILTARDYGVDAGRNPKNRGVWVGNNKMGSIGISIRHGNHFSRIRPQTSTWRWNPSTGSTPAD